MFFENARDLEIDSEDLIISSPLIHGEQKRQTEHTVCIQHLPTGISVQSSGMHMFVLKCLLLCLLISLVLSVYIQNHVPEFVNEIAMPHDLLRFPL